MSTKYGFAHTDQQITAENDYVENGPIGYVEEEDEHRAKQARYRFLRFYDEVCAGMLHSESHWEDVLDDVDFYEKYCARHPEFKNSRGGIAKDYLKDAYREDKAHGRFLTHKQIDAKGA